MCCAGRGWSLNRIQADAETGCDSVRPCHAMPCPLERTPSMIRAPMTPTREAPSRRQGDRRGDLRVIDRGRIR